MMTGEAAGLLARVRDAQDPEHNRLVPLIAAGSAPLRTLASLGAEEHLIVASDRRSFLHLAARTEEAEASGFFAALGQGEALALLRLPAFTGAAGMDAEAVAGYEPLPGCQAYPSYLSRLALSAEPAEVIVALLVNFAAWGGYCASVSRALRERYGFDDEACGFFDFFAEPVPELERQALAAVDAALAAGQRLDRAPRYARLLQSYEMSFWNTLADTAGGTDPAGSMPATVPD
jgi:hypothetical protein